MRNTLATQLDADGGQVELSPLERELMDALLDGDDPVLGVLRDQLCQSRVVSRDYTGSGFFTYFSVSDSAQLAQADAMQLGDVWFGLQGRPEGGDALLWVANGVLHSLEVIAHDGDWPEDAALDGVHYFSEPRDIQAMQGDLSSRALDYHVRLPAPRLLALIPLAVLFFVLAASASVYNTGIVMRVAPAVAAIWMAWLLVFNLWGHEVISVACGVLRVEAQLGAKTVASREFEISEVRRLRLEKAGLRKPQLACGLPLFAYMSGVGLTFDYHGGRFTFAGALDQPARAELLAAIVRRTGAEAAVV